MSGPARRWCAARTVPIRRQWLSTLSRRGIADGADAVLIDTAGRLHTKTGLMDELGKVKRVIEKQAKVDEVLLVLDATTGQNGLVQATGLRRGRRHHRHRADQTRRHRQGRHRRRRPARARTYRSSWSDWARVPTTWRRSSPRPSSTLYSATERVSRGCHVARKRPRNDEIRLVHRRRNMNGRSMKQRQAKLGDVRGSSDPTPSPAWRFDAHAVSDFAAGSSTRATCAEPRRHRLDARQQRPGPAHDARSGLLLRRPDPVQEHAEHDDDVVHLRSPSSASCGCCSASRWPSERRRDSRAVR